MVPNQSCLSLFFFAHACDNTLWDNRQQGDMLGHSGAVYDLIALSDNSVASCGADSLVNSGVHVS